MNTLSASLQGFDGDSTGSKNLYEKMGYLDREDYLNSLASENRVDPYYVHALAEVLGESEDFDGLVVMIEDM